MLVYICISCDNNYLYNENFKINIMSQEKNTIPEFIKVPSLIAYGSQATIDNIISVRHIIKLSEVKGEFVLMLTDGTILSLSENVYRQVVNQLYFNA